MISSPFDKKKAKDPVMGLEHRLCPVVQTAPRRFCAISGSASGTVSAAVLPARLLNDGNQGEGEKGS